MTPVKNKFLFMMAGWKDLLSFHIDGKKRKKVFLMNTLRLERKLLNLSILKMADGILFFASGVHALSFAKEYLGYKEAA